MFSDDLYQDRILDHYEQPFHRGTCPGATHWHEATNPFCGDRIRMELRVDNQGRIEDLYFEGEGCCVSQAAASMLVEHLHGKTLEEARLFDPGQMLSLFGAPLTITRKKCCLLPWQAIQAAIACPGISSSRVAATTAKPPPLVAAC
jgi:nitrogen fixation protein NifU and related proteins